MILLVPEGQAGTSTSTFEETFQSRQEGSQRWMPVPETKPCATTTGDHLWLVQEGGQPEAVLQSAGSLFKGDGLAGELLARCLSEVLLHCCTLSFLLCFLCFLGLGPWPRWEKGYEKVIALQGARTLGSPSAASSDSSSFFGAPSKDLSQEKRTQAWSMSFERWLSVCWCQAIADFKATKKWLDVFGDVHRSQLSGASCRQGLHLSPLTLPAEVWMSRSLSLS